MTVNVPIRKHLPVRWTASEDAEGDPQEGILCSGHFGLVLICQKINRDMAENV